jgi:hypothetical protein
MVRFLMLVALVSVTTMCLADDAATSAPTEGKMRSIFNGEDLTGWDGDSHLNPSSVRSFGKPF